MRKKNISRRRLLQTGAGLALAGTLGDTALAGPPPVRPGVYEALGVKHVINATGQPITGSATLDLVTTGDPASIQHHADIIWFANWGFILPPGVETSDSAACSVPYDVEVFGLMSHFHELGEHFTVEVLQGSLDFGVVTFAPAERGLASLSIGPDELVMLVQYVYGDGAKRIGNALQPLCVQSQPVDHRRRDVGLRGRRDILRVGRENLFRGAVDCVRGGDERGVLRLGRRARNEVRSRARLAPDLEHLRIVGLSGHCF